MKRKNFRQFDVKFSTTSAHEVSVVIHPTVSSLRSNLKSLGHKSHSDTNACCWQANSLAEDNYVAELHFALPTLCLDYVVHECTHAAWHRTRLQGLPLAYSKGGVKSDFEEFLANTTGILVANVLTVLRRNGIYVRKLLPPTP